MLRCNLVAAVFLMTLGSSTDSRLGFGFRLGEHADFQVVVELGPQRETRPIATADGSSSKREVNQQDYKRPKPTTEKPTNNSESWLQNWSSDMNTKKRKTRPNSPKKQNEKPEDSDKSYVKTMPMISESSLKQLQQLYKLASAKNGISSSESSVEDGDKRPPVDMLSIISPRSAPKIRKTKGEITEELQDVDM